MPYFLNPLKLATWFDFVYYFFIFVVVKLFDVNF
jgi:hypothetical protein